MLAQPRLDQLPCAFLHMTIACSSAGCWRLHAPVCLFSTKKGTSADDESTSARQDSLFQLVLPRRRCQFVETMAQTLRMEESLSRSFDYLSSASPTRIRKGLRQLEGTLAQICLSKPVPSKRQSMLALGSAPAVTTKNFEDLKFDHAYQEFFKLQQNFQWNITMRLISCLERLLGRESNGQKRSFGHTITRSDTWSTPVTSPVAGAFRQRNLHECKIQLLCNARNPSNGRASSSLISSILKTVPPYNPLPSSPLSHPFSTHHRTPVHSSPWTAYW